MKKPRKNTIPVLISLGYRYHKNHFEEIYGENVEYSRIEQQSYLEFKEMAYDLVSPNIKFRKFCRDGYLLTIKADCTHEEFKRFLEVLENSRKNKKKDAFSFIFNFQIFDIRTMTLDDIERNKKTQLSTSEYKFLQNQNDIDDSEEEWEEGEEDNEDQI